MSPQSEEVFLAALEDYRLALMAAGLEPGATADPGPLTAAAEGHVGASRPHDEVVSAYSAANADPGADPARVQELAQELNSVRIAQAIVDGSLPYRPPVVTTGG